MSAMFDFDVEDRAAMLLEIGSRVDVRFRKNGRILGHPVAFQSQALTRDLFKIGLFAMNVHSMATMRPASSMGDAVPQLPAALIGMAFHYGLDAAPRAPAGDALEGDVIEIADLERQVLLIERSFGAIDIDMELVAETAMRAAPTFFRRDASVDPREGYRE
jgi:hypothetical protein